MKTRFLLVNNFGGYFGRLLNSQQTVCHIVYTIAYKWRKLITLPNQCSVLTHTHIAAVGFKTQPSSATPYMYGSSRLVTKPSNHSQSSCYIRRRYEALGLFSHPGCGQTTRIHLSLFWHHILDLFKSRTFIIRWKKISQNVNVLYVVSKYSKCCVWYMFELFLFFSQTYP